jgi:carbamate kinase
VPLDSCGADTQGAIGYQIVQTLANELRRRGREKRIVALVTQTVVDRDDPGFRDPAKPIGPFYAEESAKRHQESEGWIMKEDAGRGWRRVVPSPRPLEIVEEATIRLLLEQDVIVVAGGGGGIPVIRKENGDLEGVAAVIDKDRASCLLAKRLGAAIFVLSTSVDKVSLHFGRPEQRDLDRITVNEARRFLAEGHFAAGSMKPKIEASIDFLDHGGERVIVTQPHLLEAAMRGETGTSILPG